MSVDEGSKKADEKQTVTVRVTPGDAVSAKDQLDYLIKVLGLTATYQEFPKKKSAAANGSGDSESDDGEPSTEVLTLLSISTDPPQV